MKCPAIVKGKKPCGAELQTKRTMANGNKVRRERACPKCRARFWTVEQFEKDIQGEAARYEDGIRHAEEELQLSKDRYGRIVTVVGEFHDLMHSIGKK